MQYAIGKIYKLKENGVLLKPILCVQGFHACQKINDCFEYYAFDSTNKVAEVELLGAIDGIGGNKQCTNIIKIVKEISWSDLLTLVNIGHDCTGHSNSGDRNSGHSNSGHSNSGNSNSGNWNSGNWNSGDSNSGFFNTITPNKIYVFNKLVLREEWENAIKPNFINISSTKWISFSEMTDQEKIENSSALICDGYLKKYTYKEAWANSFKNATVEDIKLLKALPNFDAKVFEEITGIIID